MKVVVVDTIQCSECGGTGERPYHLLTVPSEWDEGRVALAVEKYKAELERLKSVGIDPAKGDFT